MKHLAFLSFLLLSLRSMSQVADPASPAYRLGKAGIQHVLDSFVSAWNVHDPIAFSQVFAVDADFTNIRGISKHGRDEIARFHAGVFKTMFAASHQVIGMTKIRFIREDIAAVDAPWEITGSTGPDGQPIPLRKGLLNFTMLGVGGHWEILVMHNTDLTGMP